MLNISKTTKRRGQNFGFWLDDEWADRLRALHPRRGSLSRALRDLAKRHVVARESRGAKRSSGAA